MDKFPWVVSNRVADEWLMTSDPRKMALYPGSFLFWWWGNGLNSLRGLPEDRRWSIKILGGGVARLQSTIQQRGKKGYLRARQMDAATTTGPKDFWKLCLSGTVPRGARLWVA